MKFTTAEIARLLDTGHHGPTCDVERVVLDPDDVGVEDGQLFVASAHPPPLGDTTLMLEDNIAHRVPYLTERSWVGGTAVNGPSTETIVRAMAGDARGRPAGGPRIGVLGAVAPWATAALIRFALSDPADDRLPPPEPPEPPELREPPGSERFRLPFALLNHPDNTPLTVVLNRRHRGCTGADTSLLAPTTVVISDLGDRHLAMLGHAGAVASSKEVLDRLGLDATLMMPRAVADALRAEAGFDATAWPGLSIFDVRTDQNADAGTVHVAGPWGELAVAVGEDGAALSLPVGAAVAAGVAAGRQPEAVGWSVEAAARSLVASMVTRLAEGPVVWDRSDATSFGAVSAAIAALAERSASERFLLLGPLDDGPTVSDDLHARLARQATAAGIVVRSAGAWGTGFSPLEHPQAEADALADAGPGAVVLLAGGGAELLALRSHLLARATLAP